MARFKRRDPVFLAVQFSGSNIGEVLDELGGRFRTSYPLDADGYGSFVLEVVREGFLESFQVRRGEWVVHDPDTGFVRVLDGDEFKGMYEPVKVAGRPRVKK